MHGSERLKGTYFYYAPTSRPFRQLRKRVAFNGALCRALGARAAASYGLPAASCWRGDAFRAWLSAWQAKRALIRACNKAHSCRLAGTALVYIVASIRPKSGCSGVRSHSRTLLLCRGRVPKRSETSSGHIQSIVHVHPMRTVEHHQHARHMRGTSSRLARTAPVRAPSRHAQGTCTAARAQGCGTGCGSMLWAAMHAQHGRARRVVGRSARSGLGGRLSPIPGGSSTLMGWRSSIRGAAGWEGGEGLPLRAPGRGMVAGRGAGGCARGCGQERAPLGGWANFADPRRIEHPHGVEGLDPGRGGLGGRGRPAGSRAVGRCGCEARAGGCGRGCGPDGR